jgi:hypothetical protein
VLGVAVAGDVAYVAAGEQGLRIVDVSDPSQPQELGAYTYDDTTPGYTPGSAQDVVVAPCRTGVTLRQCAFVAEAPGTAGGSPVGGGLRIINVNDSANPAQIGYYRLGQAANAVEVTGKGGESEYAYLATANGLILLDVEQANRPEFLDGLNTPAAAWDVAVDGMHAYVAAGSAGLRVVDVSERTALRTAGTFAGLTAARGVTVAKGRAYVADGTRGLVLLDIATDPAHPQELGQVTGSAIALALGVDLPYWHPGTPQEIGRDTVGPIGPLGAAQARTTWIPTALETFAIYAMIDPDNNLVGEVKESNNLGYIPVTTCLPGGKAVSVICRGGGLPANVVLPSDVRVVPEEIGFQATAAVGNLVRLRAGIESLAGIHSYVPVQFYKGDPDAGGELIGSDTVKLISPGGVGQVEMLWDTTGQNVQAYDIWVVVPQQPAEADLVNNKASGGTITLTPRPDSGTLTHNVYLPLVIR